MNSADSSPQAAPSTPPSAVAEEALHALVDGRLTPAQRVELEARLAHDPSAASTRDAWAAQREALRGLHVPLLHEPVPESLRAAVTQFGDARHEIARWQRWGGIAAGVVLAFAVGWLARGAQMVGASQLAGATQRVPAAGPQFVHQAALAHLVYAPEVRHPVEVTAAQQEHLVQWLSKRVGRPLKVPNLAGEGYELVGGRLLPGEQGARAQFMFQNSTGQRITLYLGAVDAIAAGGPADAAPQAQRQTETAFRLSTEGPVPSFYWVDRGFGYALAGQVPKDVLLKLAEEVYRQL